MKRQYDGTYNSNTSSSRLYNNADLMIKEYSEQSLGNLHTI